MAAGLNTEAAVQMANRALVELDAGPELIRACDPAAVIVDWEVKPAEPRINKMDNVRSKVRSYLNDYLHQMPQVLLVAEDGAVVTVYGWEHGTATGLTPPLRPVLAEIGSPAVRDRLS